MTYLLVVTLLLMGSGVSRIQQPGTPPPTAPPSSVSRDFDPLAAAAQTCDSSIQFDTKGVDFGKWLKRFQAQLHRNWFPPREALSEHGHVAVAFDVFKDGSLKNVKVVGPAEVQAFNWASSQALIASNPTEPLPPDYPAEEAHFFVTFCYNEKPTKPVPSSAPLFPTSAPLFPAPKP